MQKNVFLFLFILCSYSHTHGQVLTDSNLPIVIIQTDNSAPIPDEPGVRAGMKIINRGPGMRNYVSDQDSAQFLDFDGRIDIELRGSASQAFPKKAYGFTTLLPDNVTPNDVRLLGMPEENDWILDGLSSDPSLVRNFLAYTLSRQLGQYASRTVYCEVIVNDDYKGLYLLEEKIKPDKNRVNVLKIEQNENVLPELTGGYITKTDKTTGNDPVAWSMSSYIGFNDNQFIHHWPKPENVTTQQNTYIKSVFLQLQAACTAGNASPLTGYPSIIDVPSFVDFILINELASNVDAYTFSTFYHKDRNGKLRAGPVWDLNLTFGNDLFIWGFDRSKPDVWQFANGSLEGPKYYRDLYNNAPFKCYLARRWNELKKQGQPFNLDRLYTFIDSTVTLLQEAAAREEDRWGTIGHHADSVAALKDWLDLRIPWITNHLGSSAACDQVATPPLVLSAINYHPQPSALFPEEDKLEFLGMTNAGSTDLDLTGIYFGGTGLVYQFPPGSTLPAGATLTLASDAITYNAKYGTVPFGQFTRSLSNQDQHLVLADAFGNEIDHVHYMDELPWPDADGNGLYLQLISDTLDNSLASSWVAVEDHGVSTVSPLRKSQVLVFPNPSTGRVQVFSTQVMTGILITDLQGRPLFHFDVRDVAFSFDLSSLPPGLYFARITVDGDFRTEKIIVN